MEYKKRKQIKGFLERLDQTARDAGRGLEEDGTRNRS